MDHLPAFVAGTLLAKCIDDLGLELEAASFDGGDTFASFVVAGRAGTRLRISVDVVSADSLSELTDG